MHHTEADIDRQMERYLAANEMAGAALIVRKDGREVYRGKWGHANREDQRPVEYDTIFRMASMSKPVTAIAVMTLVEQGKLGLDDPLCRHLPQFGDQKVCATPIEPGRPPSPDLLDEVEYVPAARPVSIRDLLSHSSGMGMGVIGEAFIRKVQDSRDNLADRVEKWGAMPLDFQPGEGTGYSGLANFDILGRVVEVLGGVDFRSYLKRIIWEPLGMASTDFLLDEEQRKRLAVLYTTEEGRLIPMPEEQDRQLPWDAESAGYFSGAGGMYSTAEDYDKITSLLASEGDWNGVRILQPETVRLMHTEAAARHMELMPGTAWGLGLLIVHKPELAPLRVAPGTYWWSGAWGTHMFIDPTGKLSATFVMNRFDIGGAASPIARKVEELVFGTWR